MLCYLAAVCYCQSLKRELQRRVEVSSTSIDSTVEPGDSKPVDSKLHTLVNFLLLTKISDPSINHMIESKHLAIVNIFVPLKKLSQI